MFKSKTRPVLFTQYEHGRLAGTLAQMWGNELFAPPALDFDAFVAGVMLHDWGYGMVDNLPIGEAPEDKWLDVIRKGVEKRHSHPVTDIVVKLHLRRLLSLHTSPEREALIGEVNDRIDDRLQESAAPLEDFRRADKITQLCDMISFCFCFESPIELTYEVYSRPDATETTSVTFTVRPGGGVRVSPWPFSVPAISGTLYAFERQDYPEMLNPFIVSFNIVK